MLPLLCGRVVDNQVVPGHCLGLVDFGQEQCVVFLDLVPEAQKGDYVLVQSGCAIQKLDGPIVT